MPVQVQSKGRNRLPVLSTSLVLLAILLLGDAVVRYVQPLQYIADPRLRPIQYDPWVAKFPRFFESNANPDLVIIGSSLPMAAFGRYDSLFDKNESLSTAANLRTYLDSKYFANLLRRNVLASKGESVKYSRGIGNLTCAGCMVSDAYVICDGLLTKKQAPQTVIFGIAPRDFQDNCMPKMGDSPILQVVPSCETWADVKRARNATEFLSRLTACLSDFYRSRRKYRDVLAVTFSEWSKHPQTLSAVAAVAAPTCAVAAKANSESQSKSVSKPDLKQVLEEDLATYKGRYNPFNEVRFAQENDYFRKLIKRLSDKNIQVVLVRMPITDRNQALIPAKLASGFGRALAAVKNLKGVRYIEFSPAEFTQADFVDSVHLNETGSKKFQDKLAALLQHS